MKDKLQKKVGYDLCSKLLDLEARLMIWVESDSRVLISCDWHNWKRCHKPQGKLVTEEGAESKSPQQHNLPTYFSAEIIGQALSALWTLSHCFSQQSVIRRSALRKSKTLVGNNFKGLSECLKFPCEVY